MSNYYIGDVLTFTYKQKEYNAEIESIKDRIFIIKNLVTNTRSSLTWNSYIDNFWFTANGEYPINLLVSKSAIFPFDDLPLYLKKEIIVFLEHDDFVNLAKTNKEMYKLISGKIDDDFRILNGNIDSRIYEERSKSLFRKKVYSLRDEELITWRSFYFRIMKYMRSKEFTSDNIDDAVNKGDLLRLKYLNTRCTLFLSLYENTIEHLLQKCIACGYIHMLNWFALNNKLPRPRDIEFAIIADQIDVCKWFEEKNLLPGKWDIYNIKGLSMLKWLCDRGYKLIKNVKELPTHEYVMDDWSFYIKLCKINNRIFNILHACDGGYDYNQNILFSNYADQISGGVLKLKILASLQSEFNIRFSSIGPHVAAINGKIDMLNWYAEHGILPDQSTADIVVEREHVDVLKWLFSKNIIPSYHAYDHPAKKENIEMLDLLYKNNVPINEGYLDYVLSRNSYSPQVTSWFKEKKEKKEKK